MPLVLTRRVDSARVPRSVPLTLQPEACHTGRFTPLPTLQTTSGIPTADRQMTAPERAWKLFRMLLTRPAELGGDGRRVPLVRLQHQGWPALLAAARATRARPGQSPTQSPSADEKRFARVHAEAGFHAHATVIPVRVCFHLAPMKHRWKSSGCCPHLPPCI